MEIEGCELNALLRAARRARASDVHLTAGEAARVRVDGDLVGLRGFEPPMAATWVESAVRAVMTTSQRLEFDVVGEVDLAYDVTGAGRVRLHAYRHSGGAAAAIRLVPVRAASLGELGLPEIVRTLARRPRGLVLVTGATGAGKSATLAGMVSEISSTRSAHIVTVEDPVEFVFPQGRSLIHQREVGADTASFPEAIRRALRQDPDVLVLGELRDRDSFAAALTAAETGHLVLATVHTQSAAKTLTRIVDAFPAGRRESILAQLALTLQGVVSQTLLPRAQGPGRALATEVMVTTPAVARLVRAGDVAQIGSLIQAGAEYGMHTMDQDLRRLVESGQITREVALPHLIDSGALDVPRVDVRAA